MSVAQIESTDIQMRPPAGGLWTDAWSRLRKNPGAIVGAFIVASFLVMAIFAPVIAPYSPKQVNLDALGTSCCPGPSSQHWLGVDQLGRDELCRIVYGARYSLVIGVVAVAAGLTIGLLFGATAGYLGGFTDSVIMRCMDVMLAIPGLLLAIGIVAALGTGLWQIMIAVGITNVPMFARLLRGSSSSSASRTSSWRRGRSACAAERSSSGTSSRTRSRR